MSSAAKMELVSDQNLNAEVFGSSDVTLKDIFVSKIKDPTLTEDVDDPFYIGDLGDIIKKHQTWIQNLPRVEPFYAVKANPEDQVLKLLAGLNTGFDCASKKEIQGVLKFGVCPSRIIFANPCKQRSHLKYAAENNVRLMTFDNEVELVKIKEVFPEARPLLRITTDDSHSRFKLSDKFGCAPHDAPGLLRKAKDLELDVVGISFHVGSQCNNPVVFKDAIKNSKELFDFGNDLGLKMNLLDIGGGFHGKKLVPIKFEEFTIVINQALAENFPVGCGVRVIAEPGRYYVESAFTLAINIISKRMVARDVAKMQVHEKEDVSPEGDDPAFMYYVNDGLYGSFNGLLHGCSEIISTPLKERLGDVPMFSTSVWGPTCDSLDRIIEDRLMPELEVGEWLLFHDMGAYKMYISPEFNGFKQPIAYYIISKECLSMLKQMKDQSQLSNTCNGSFSHIDT